MSRTAPVVGRELLSTSCAYLLARIREAFDCDRMLHLHVGAASVQWTS